MGSREWGVGSDGFPLPLPTPYSPLPTPQSERLSEPNMNRSAWLTQDGAGGCGERRRVNQVTVINPDRPQWRVDPKSHPDRVGHIAEVEIAGAPENIAQIVKRHETQATGERVTHFEIEDRHSVAARRNERRQYAREVLRPISFVAPVIRIQRRLDDGLRPRGLELKPAQVSGAARKESFADRQTPLLVVGHAVAVAVDYAVAVAVGHSGSRSQTDAGGKGQRRIAEQRRELIERFVPLIGREEFVERFRAAEHPRGD